MPLFKTIKKGYRDWNWSLTRCVFHFIKGVSDRLNLCFPWVSGKYVRYVLKDWLKTPLEGPAYFDFAGAKIPYVDPKKNYRIYDVLLSVFQDTFTVPCLYGDCHDKRIVERLDAVLPEGPYGYADGPFDVTVKAGDVVVDAGAWIGDFSAYAAARKAVCYAFEPMAETYGLLQETARCNNVNGDIYIVPVPKGLGAKQCRMSFNTGVSQSGADAFLTERDGQDGAFIEVTTIDDFVRENNLQRVDFIKSDIEGAERDMLRGARETLRRFAPKLAICTYHLPDDPQVLEQIIKEANPDYTVVHLRHKLMAMVVK